MSIAHIALTTSGAPPVWSSPMELKHLDVVRSDVDGELYILRNNVTVAAPITVGPGNPATAAAAWTTGWRRLGESEQPGDVAELTDVGGSAIITRGIKKYIRSGLLVEASPSDYPTAPLNLFSPFKHWESSPITDPPAVTTAAAIGGLEGITTGPNAGIYIALSGASSAVADAPKSWRSMDGGKNWALYATSGDTSQFNRRMACNDYDVFYWVDHAFSTINRWRFVNRAYVGDGGTIGDFGIILGTGFATGALEYVGSSGAKPTTDCLILLNPVNMVAGSSTSISVTVNGGVNWSRPAFNPITSVMKPVMALSNKQGHVVILGASKASGTPGVKCWYNNNFASGEWGDAFESTAYYNVCGGCWDGEKYVVALQSSTSVDLFTGVVQGDGNVTFTKVSTTSLATYITGDGHKHSGNGIYAYNGQYLLRMTAKLTIFPSLKALCETTLSPYTPSQGDAVLNSGGFAFLGDKCLGFNGRTPWSSKLTLGTITPYKNNPDVVQVIRLQ